VHEGRPHSDSFEETYYATREAGHPIRRNRGLFSIEAEYAQAVRRAELEWVRRIVDEIRSGNLEWPRAVLEAQGKKEIPP